MLILYKKQRGKIMKKVLFIGNSHTYFNDMAAMFMAMANSYEALEKVEVTMLAHPYVTLDYHKGQPEIRFNILYGGYDYVILQQAAHPFGGEEELKSGVKAINEFIKEAGATPVLYMTWCEKAKPENQSEMTSAYVNAAQRIDAILAPVGKIFEKVREENPSIELYNEDGGHASKEGSYLAAATLVSSIFKVDPRGIELRLKYNGKELCSIEESIGNIIKSKVYETVK